LIGTGAVTAPLRTAAKAAGTVARPLSKFGKAGQAVADDSKLLNALDEEPVFKGQDTTYDPTKVAAVGDEIAVPAPKRAEGPGFLGEDTTFNQADVPVKDAPVIEPTSPLANPSTLIEQKGFTPSAYSSAIDLAVKWKTEGSGLLTASDLARVNGIKVSQANKIVKQMREEGILDAPVPGKKTGPKEYPILATEFPAVHWGQDIVESNAKIQGAAKVANAVAPETVRPLPVQNTPRTEIPNMAPQGQGMIGSELINKARPNLLDPATGKELYRPGRERAQALRSEVLPMWSARVNAEASKGAKPVLFASDDTPYTLSIPHVLEALPERLVDDMMFGASYNKYNKNANLYHTQVGRGIAEALRQDDLRVPLMADRYKAVAEAITKAAPSKRGSRKPPRGAVMAAARGLVDNVDKIREVQFSLAKTLGKKDVEDAADIYHDYSSKLMATLDDTSLPSSVAMADLASVGSSVAPAAKALGASDNAASLASSEIAELTAKVAPEADVAASKAAAATSRERKLAEETGKNVDETVNRKVQKELAVAAKEADQMNPAAAADSIDLSIRADMHFNNMMAKMLSPVRNLFQRGYGYKDFADGYRAGTEVAATQNTNNTRRLNKMSKEQPKEVWNTMFSAYKRGEAPTAPGLAGVYNEMGLAIDRVHDVGDGYFGALWRTGAGVEEINKGLRQAFGPETKFQYKITKKQEKAGISVADQWKTWDITDSMDYLSRSYDVMIKLAAKQAFATDFALNFGKSGPAPGLVKIHAGEDSILGTFIQKDKWFDREIAEQLTRLDAAIKAPTSYRGEKGTLANFMNHVVEPVLQLWKPYMTIFRPGHGIRNMIGAMFAALLDGVMHPGSYVKGFKMMQAGGGLKKTMEGLNALDDAATGVNGAHVMSTVRLRGRNESISYDRAYQLAHKQGLFISYMASDDLLDATNKVSKFMLENPYMKAMGQFNEQTSNGMRAGHFVNLMQRTSFTRQFATLEDAAFAEATRIKRFQPDPNGLAPFEKKTMRRLIPFYTWFRQAIPMVATTLMSHPGRLTVPFKAQYNASVAMGQNPDSMTEPFDPNKLYPEFIRNGLTGPVVGDLTFNLGSPSEAIFHDIIGKDALQTGRNLAGMLNPIPKGLIEGSTQTSLGTGRQLYDTTEYADSLVPVVNQIAGVGGVSTFGSLQSLLQGAPKIDPTRAVARGEKEHFFNLNLLNFLSGLGVQDTTKESYTNIARKEG
jgi:hypothetical protein